MGIALFMTLIFLHIALGLALAFMVMYFAFKTEHIKLKNFGFVVGYLLITLAVLAMIMSAVFVSTKPHFMPCPYKMHEKMMEQGMPMMNEQKEENQEHEDKIETKNHEKITYENEKIKGCPVKTKTQLEKDLKEGKITGAACSAKE